MANWMESMVEAQMDHVEHQQSSSSGTAATRNFEERDGGFCFPNPEPHMRGTRNCVICLLLLEVLGVTLVAAALGVAAKAHEGGAALVFLAISVMAATLCAVTCAVVVCCCQTRCSFS